MAAHGLAEGRPIRLTDRFRCIAAVQEKMIGSPYPTAAFG